MLFIRLYPTPTGLRLLVGAWCARATPHGLRAASPTMEWSAALHQATGHRHRGSDWSSLDLADLAMDMEAIELVTMVVPW